MFFKNLFAIFTTPSLHAKTFNDTPHAVLEYALWIVGDREDELFIPVVISFKDADKQAADVKIIRYGGQDDEEFLEISDCLSRAFEDFEQSPKGDWDVIIYEATMNDEGGEKLNCFTGKARNNLTKQEIEFIRPFEFNGKKNVWADALTFINQE